MKFILSIIRKWLPPLTVIGLTVAFVLSWQQPVQNFLPDALLGRTENSKRTPTRFPSNILINSKHFQYTEEGTLKSRLTATNSQYFQRNSKRRADTDVAKLTDPRMIIYRPDGTPWHAKSKRATTSKGGAQIELYGAVQLWNEKPNDRSDITSTYMKVLPEQQYAETDKPVTIRRTGELTEATGMRASLAEDKIELLSNVRGTYAAKH